MKEYFRLPASPQNRAPGLFTIVIIIFIFPSTLYNYNNVSGVRLRQFQSARKSALLSSAKKAKLKSNPSRVRFAEGVLVNGSPLCPVST